MNRRTKAAAVGGVVAAALIGGVTGAAPAAAATGVIAYETWEGYGTNGQSDIWTMDAGGTGQTNVTPNTADSNEYDPEISPDGSRIAFISNRIAPTNEDATYEIFTMAFDGSDVRQVTTVESPYGSGIASYDPTWSPDGTKLAFNGFRQYGTSEIYTINTDGSGSETKLTNPADFQGKWEPDWSPDGTTILFTKAWDEWSQDLFVINVDGTGERNLTPDADPENPTAERNGVWSPDGSRIAFRTDRDCCGIYPNPNAEIYVMEYPSGTVTRVTEHNAIDEEPAWSPDASQIAFVSLRDGGYDLFVTDAPPVPAFGSAGWGDDSFGARSQSAEGPVTPINSSAGDQLDPYWAGGSTPPPVTHTLTVTKAGSGTGRVMSSPAGISCGTDCTEPYAQGTSVTLTATPGKGYSFGGWSGACSGTQLTCTAQMSAARSVTATFGSSTGGGTTPPKGSPVLTVTRTGNGTVVSSPAGISCGTDCSQAYASGTQVTLTARAVKGSSTFTGWGGACSGTSATCVVTMNGAKSVTATFRAV